MAKITKRVVDAAKPGKKPAFIWDDRLSGFGLLTLPSGVRSFVYQYRDQHGRTRRATVGRFGDWTADQARKAAEALRDKVRTGIDPLGEKRDARTALTVAQLLEDYQRSAAFTAKSLERQKLDAGRIRRHIVPLLGTKVADAMKREDFAKALSHIREGRTSARVKTKARGLAVVKGGHAASVDCGKLLRAAMNWGVTEGKIKSNATLGVKVGKHRRRNAIIEDAVTYQKLFETMARMQAEKRLHPNARAAITIVALTGCRRNEIADLRRSHVDLRRGVIELAPEEHKSGEHTGDPRVVALPSVAQMILAQQPSGPTDGLVFPSNTGNKFALSKVFALVRDEAGFPRGITLHNLRHSIGSNLAATGGSAPQIAQVLGHSQIETAMHYVHAHEAARNPLAERAASLALTGLAAAGGTPSAEVVEIKGGRRGK